MTVYKLLLLEWENAQGNRGNKTIQNEFLLNQSFLNVEKERKRGDKPILKRIGFMKQEKTNKTAK